ncbi:plasmid partitioning protein RepA [Microvirga sp. 3-52]|jgi:chromosome partitioning protein|nr:plasmid partitioning protein RepA [Microvirga sp. 3-52]
MDTGAPFLTPKIFTRERVTQVIAQDGDALSKELNNLRNELYAPEAQKTLRSFTSGEAAKLIGVADGYLRQLSLAGKGPQPTVGQGNRRSYTLEQINELRRLLDEGAKNKKYLPHRSENEHCQVIAVANFKGGSGKTTTAAHLAQYMALQGYRVLAVDLDPQASLTALHGYQPEMDIEADNTIYGAIKYDGPRQPLSGIIRKTYFPGLDLVPGNIELQEYEHEAPRFMSETNGGRFWDRISNALASVEHDYDVMILDCPPQLGYITLGALCAATSLLITVHPQMLDVMSMCQFLQMAAALLEVVQDAVNQKSTGQLIALEYDFLRYAVTRFEPNDGPQNWTVGLMRTLFRERVLNSPILKSTAIEAAGLSKQTLYEVSREDFTRTTYDRAIESLESIGAEIQTLMKKAWGRE